MHSKISQSIIVTCLIAGTFTHAFSQTIDDCTKLYQDGKYRQALAGYQQLVLKTAVDNKKMSTLPTQVNSDLIQTDSPVLLQAHCLYEEGLLDYLNNNKTGATESWSKCFTLLQKTPAKDDAFSRRVSLALFQLQMGTYQDLPSLLSALQRTVVYIDNYPLPENSFAYKDQIKTEYLLYSASRIFLRIKASNESTTTEPASQEQTGILMSDLYSQRAVYHLLMSNSDNKPLTYEAIEDRLLFQDSYEPTFNLLSNFLRSNLVPSKTAAQSQGAALLTAWSAESSQPEKMAYNFKSATNGGKQLDWESFNKHLQTCILLAENFKFSELNKPILGFMAANVTQLPWNDEKSAARFSTLLSKYGYADAATKVINEGDTAVSSNVSIEKLMARLDLFFDQEKYASAIQMGEKLETDPRLTSRAKLFYTLGLSHAKLSHTKQAIAYLDKYLKENSHAEDTPDTMLFLARLYLSSGDRTGATKMFNQLITNYPDTSYASQAKSSIYQLTQPPKEDY